MGASHARGPGGAPLARDGVGRSLCASGTTGFSGSILSWPQCLFGGGAGDGIPTHGKCPTAESHLWPEICSTGF